MDRTPQHPDQGDRYEAYLREHHKLVRQFDVSLKEFKDYFHEHLPEVTRDILDTIPRQREAWRQEALRRYGYDLEHSEWASSPEESMKSPDDVQGFLTLANHHGTYRIIMELWEFYVQAGFSGTLLQAARARLLALELAGENPTPLEVLLSDRVASLWVLVELQEALNAAWYRRDKMGKTSPAFMLGMVRLQESAHRRYLQAVKTLAQVQRLRGLSRLQVNIGGRHAHVSS